MIARAVQLAQGNNDNDYFYDVDDEDGDDGKNDDNNCPNDDDCQGCRLEEGKPVCFCHEGFTLIQVVRHQANCHIHGFSK